jgi:altronate hydrolase
VLVLDAADNVAVALVDLEPGDLVTAVPEPLHAATAVRAAHKVSLAEIDQGAAVIKYGEVIGIASEAIPPGVHVHVHNVASSRLPGPGR